VEEYYPRDLGELEAKFGTEEACRAYLAWLRWPEGFRCRRCGGGRSWPVRGSLLECAGCGCQTSVTVGTIFQDTRTPLPVWFRAMWWVTTQKNGASALGLQRVLGLKSYEAIGIRSLGSQGVHSLAGVTSLSICAMKLFETYPFPGATEIRFENKRHSHAAPFGSLITFDLSVRITSGVSSCRARSRYHT
jgi:hypothetical protein